MTGEDPGLFLPSTAPKQLASPSAWSRHECPRVVSVLVSFTPVRQGARPYAERTLTSLKDGAGRTRTAIPATRKRVWGQLHRGFESHRYRSEQEKREAPTGNGRGLTRSSLISPAGQPLGASGATPGTADGRYFLSLAQRAVDNGVPLEYFADFMAAVQDRDTIARLTEYRDAETDPYLRDSYQIAIDVRQSSK